MGKFGVALALLSFGGAGMANATTSWTVSDDQQTLSGTGNAAFALDGETLHFTFKHTPSPTIIVTGDGFNFNGTNFDTTFDYMVEARGPASPFQIPASCSSRPGYPPCQSPYSNDPLFTVLKAPGDFYLAGRGAYLTAYVGPDSFPFASCDSGLTPDCGLHTYQQPLVAAGYYTQYGGTIVITVPMELRLTGEISSGRFTAAIDPVLALDPDFLAQAGLNASDFTIDTGAEGNASNAAEIRALAGNVPEPATWVLLIGGFGAVGARLRWRRVFATAGL